MSIRGIRLRLLWNEGRAIISSGHSTYFADFWSGWQLRHRNTSNSMLYAMCSMQYVVCSMLYAVCWEKIKKQHRIFLGILSLGVASRPLLTFCFFSIPYTAYYIQHTTYYL